MIFCYNIGIGLNPSLTNMVELKLFQIYHLKEMSLAAELFLSCSILQFTFYAISTAYQRKTGFIVLNKQVYYVATLFIILSGLLLLNEDLLIANSLSSNDFIINDYFGFASKTVVCFISVLFLIIINVSFQDEPIQNNFEYSVLIVISILGILLLCSSNDLITAYLAIELQSVAFYIMSAFKRNSSYSIESGLKYFIIGSLSSAFFLFGSSLVYGCTGSLSFDDLQIFFSLFFAIKSDVFLSSRQIFFDNFSENELIFSILSTDLNSDLMRSIPLYASFFEPSLSYKLLNLTIVTKTPDNLIDWCIKNNPETFSEIFFLSLLGAKVSNFLSIDFVDLHPLEYFVLLDQYSVDTYWGFYLYPFFFCCKENWVNLVLLNQADLNLVLLQQIFLEYNDLSLASGLNILPALNLDLILVGFFLICISLFIKLAIVPFHFWSLDVYEGSPNVTTFFFAVVPKIALFLLLMRICYIGFYPTFVAHYQIFFFALAVLSVFVGSFGGLGQRKLKTLLAYSSISHTGYLLLSFSTGNIEGIHMMFYYLVIYMISGLCFWSIYLFLRQKRNFYLIKSNKELGDLVLLKESNPMLAFILAMTLFSIAGIPPIVGFLAKIGVFLVVVKSASYSIAALTILFSVISTFYYIRLIKILYFENVLVGKLYMSITTQKALIISFLALLLIILCVNPALVYLLFYKAVLLL